jgi:predicted esterase
MRFAFLEGPSDMSLSQMCSRHAQSIPIFWGHGTADPLINIELGRKSVEFLKTDLGLPQPPHDAPDAAALKGVTFMEYPGLQHGAGPQELSDLKEWIKKVLPQ